MKMSKPLAAITVFLFLSWLASAARGQSQPDGSLIIEAVGFANRTGHATIGLFASEIDFKAADVRKERKDVQKYFHSLQDVQIKRVGSSLTAVCRIDNLKPGEYSAFIFQDRNRNGKVDSNLICVPVEPFGFSNDVRPQMFPIPKAPTWKSIAFTIKPGENSIRIQVQE